MAKVTLTVHKPSGPKSEFSPLLATLSAITGITTMAYLIGKYKKRKKYEQAAKEIEDLAAKLRSLSFEKSSFEKSADSFWEYLLTPPVGLLAFLGLYEFYKKKLKQYSEQESEKLNKKLEQLTELTKQSSEGWLSTARRFAKAYFNKVWPFAVGLTMFTPPVLGAYILFKWILSKEEKEEKMKKFLASRLGKPLASKLLEQQALKLL